MATQDNCCSISPYIKIGEGNLAAFKALGEEFVAATSKESGCLYYGLCFDGDVVHFREGYENAEAALAHLGNIGELLAKALQLGELTRLEVHGPEQELAKLREPMSAFSPQYFVLESGFRR